MVLEPIKASIHVEVDSGLMEASILKTINQYPGCTPGRFNTKECQHIQTLITAGKVIVRYAGMMPHYYPPNQPPTYNLRYIIEAAEAKIRKHRRMIEATGGDIRYEEGVVDGVQMALDTIKSEEMPNEPNQD